MTRARELGKLANKNTLTADNTNNFVGIASTQPTTRLDVVGVVSATSFSGDGSGLTGIAATDNVSTNGLVVLGISTLSGAVSVGDTISLGDHDRLRFGAGNDLQIYHDGTDSRIENSTGDIKLKNTGSYFFFDEDGGETLASFINDGAVNLYYDNSLKLETKTDGVDITGELQCDSLDVDGAGDITGVLTLHNNLDLQDNDKILIGTSDDLEIYHSGSHSFIKDSGTGNLYINSNNVVITNAADNEALASFIENGAVELYYDGTKKFETTSDGVTVTGTIDGQTELRTWLFG